MTTDTPQLQESLKTLKKQGIRITPQREIILTYLINHHDHPSVEMIHDAIDKQLPNLSVATIYNTLKLFVDTGLAIELPNKDGGVRYDFFGVPHFHAICENCGRIFDVFDDDYPAIVQRLKDIAHDKTGLTVTGAQVEVTGICPNCVAKEKAAKN